MVHTRRILMQFGTMLWNLCPSTLVEQEATLHIETSSISCLTDPRKGCFWEVKNHRTKKQETVNGVADRIAQLVGVYFLPYFLNCFSPNPNFDEAFNKPMSRCLWSWQMGDHSMKPVDPKISCHNPEKKLTCAPASCPGKTSWKYLPNEFNLEVRQF